MGESVMPRDVCISVDPGEVHNGLAVWMNLHVADGSGEGWRVIHVETIGPWALYDQVVELVQTFGAERFKAFVVEEYRLYPWMLHQQGFSQVLTVERIGVLRFMAHRYGITFVGQGASIKKMATVAMKRNKYEWKGGNQHGRDAEMHGWWYLNQHLV